MITKARARFIRITPRKFRQIIPLIKGRNPEEAIAILASVKKRASEIAIELLKSAVANAKHIQGVEVANLYISRIFADCGPSLKRYRAASMGRASPIIKRTSHITIELDEAPHKKEAEPKKKTPRVAATAPKGDAKKAKETQTSKAKEKVKQRVHQK